MNKLISTQCINKFLKTTIQSVFCVMEETKKNQIQMIVMLVSTKYIFYLLILNLTNII